GRRQGRSGLLWLVAVLATGATARSAALGFLRLKAFFSGARLTRIGKCRHWRESHQGHSGGDAHGVRFGTVGHWVVPRLYKVARALALRTGVVKIRNRPRLDPRRKF